MFVALALLVLAGGASASVVCPEGQEEDSRENLGLLRALEMTLERDPNIALGHSQVDSARSRLLVSGSAFEPTLDASVARSDIEIPVVGGEDERRETLVQSVSLSKQLRSGLSLEPRLDLTRDEQAATDIASVAFTLRQPLLRGRGREAVTAEEQATRLELEASILDLRQIVAERLLTVTVQYWNTVAARLNLEILCDSEASSRRLAGNIRRLIEADRTPAAEILQVEADLAAKEADRIGGERSLFRNRQDLKREIGVELDELAALPLPSELFPEPPPGSLPSLSSASLLLQAQSQRSDLGAVRLRNEATKRRLHATEQALEPRLDLSLTPSYSGLEEGARGLGDLFAPLYTRIPGLSTTIGLSFSWAPRNERARGDLLGVQSSLHRSDLQVELLSKRIASEVPAALDAVLRSTEQLERAVAAVGLFEQAVVNEEKKLRAGRSTLLDLISQSDRLTAARQRQVSAQLNLALALAELRFQTGSLLVVEPATTASDTDAYLLSLPQLTTIPGQEEAP